VTPELRLLATLAVALAPSRAPRLLGRLGLPGGAEAIRLAEALALAPRRTRLAALAAAISAAAPAPALRPGEVRPVHPPPPAALVGARGRRADRRP
jgi:hypothetical protein